MQDGWSSRHLLSKCTVKLDVYTVISFVGIRSQHHWISLVLCCHGSSCDTSRDSREALQQAECQVDSQGNKLGAHTWMVNHGQSLVSCRNLSSQLKHIASVDGCRFQAELLIPCGNKLGECPVWDDTRALKQSCGEAKRLNLLFCTSSVATSDNECVQMCTAKP